MQMVDDAKLPKPSAYKQASKPAASHLSDEQVDRWIKVFELDDSIVRLEPRMPVEVERPTHREIPSGERPKQAVQADKAQAADDDDIQPVLPPSLIEQAEQLWRETTESTPKPPEKDHEQ
jgi:hypothetical protein